LEWVLINLTFVLLSIMTFQKVLKVIIKRLVGQDEMEVSFAGTVGDPARVLLVGSDRHWGPPVLGFSPLGASLPLALGNLTDLQFKSPGSYGAWKAFGQAALCNVLFSYELQKRLRVNDVRTVSVTCFDPGPMSSAWHKYRKEENRLLIQNDMPRGLKRFYSYFTRLIEQPEVAAEAPILLATSSLGAVPCSTQRLGGVGYSCYFVRESPVPSKYPVPWSQGTSYDEDVWGQLWQYAEALTEGYTSAEAQQALRREQRSLSGMRRLKLPKVLPPYVWFWLWWHAPRSLATLFVKR
jgi:hypothetical protein